MAVVAPSGLSKRELRDLNEIGLSSNFYKNLLTYWYSNIFFEHEITSMCKQNLFV